MYINEKEYQAICNAEDFIEHNLDGANDEALKDLQELVRQLRAIKQKIYKQWIQTAKRTKT